MPGSRSTIMSLSARCAALPSPARTFCFSVRSRRRARRYPLYRTGKCQTQWPRSASLAPRRDRSNGQEPPDQPARRTAPLELEQPNRQPRRLTGCCGPQLTLTLKRCCRAEKRSDQDGNRDFPKFPAPRNYFPVQPKNSRFAADEKFTGKCLVLGLFSAQKGGEEGKIDQIPGYFPGSTGISPRRRAAAQLARRVSSI